MRYSSVVLVMLLIFAFAGFFALEVWQNNQNNNNTQQLVSIDPTIYGYIVAGLQALINVVINILLVAAMNVLSIF
jgi:predicted negative regulator of RcsB-dependent stress response